NPTSPTPNPTPCATACGTCPPGSPTTPAAAGCTSAEPGPGATRSSPAGNACARCHRRHRRQRRLDGHQPPRRPKEAKPPQSPERGDPAPRRDRRRVRHPPRGTKRIHVTTHRNLWITRPTSEGSRLGRVGLESANRDLTEQTSELARDW